MRSESLGLRGAVLIRPDVHSDERGTFRRLVDAEEFRGLGLDPTLNQLSMATNRLRGTVRGMHYQVAPREETKTLWCTSGSAFDVLVDLRPDEPTYGKWVAVELRASDTCAVYIPPGVAHGYQTLSDDTTLCYLISEQYDPGCSRSLSWRDESVGIDWPLPVTVMSDRDREAPPWPPSR